VVTLLLVLPIAAYAQEATISGTVTDSTGGVLPGVTVVAVHEATGNTFETVTDGEGRYRIGLRTGLFRLTSELAGFATMTRNGLEILLNQQAVVDIRMRPSTLEETVTVTGDAPLVDVTHSRAAGNIDSRQMQELPINGRNWMDLSMLAPGSRTNAVTDAPTTAGIAGTYQLNLDGQQVTQNVVGASFGNPRYSRDAIAEFEFVANRFDATQGRSSGVQVNAITKSGTNTNAGTFSAYFRDDRFNAADFIVNRVLPYSNTQLSATFGGPIRRDRIHYFGNYEYEREPQTITFNTPYPRFNVDLSGTRREHKGGVRVDVQMSPQRRLSVRYSKWNQIVPYRTAGGATTTPSTAEGADRFQDQLLATLTQVFGTHALNEIKAGYASFRWAQYSQIRNPGSLSGGAKGPGWGAPGVLLLGLTIGGSQSTPQDLDQATYSIRDDFTRSYSKRGRHDLKLGGEYIYQHIYYYVCRTCIGVLDANLGPVPANVQDLFPNQFDVSTWNLAPLSPISRRWRQGVGDFDFVNPRHTYGLWAQDDWFLTSRLTLNLGVRYDMALNSYENGIGLGPFLPAERANDLNNLAPRLGFAISVTDRTVLRGGFGKFYGEEQNPHPVKAFNQAAIPERLNDGRANFAADPWNGPSPTYEEVLASGLRRDITTAIPGPEMEEKYSYQGSVGMQRQLGESMAIEADYVFTGGRLEQGTINANLSYNPATGANYPFTDISRRPYPTWGSVSMRIPGGWSNYHGLQTNFTKRMSHGWQASGTYTLEDYKDASPLPVVFKAESPWAGSGALVAARDVGGEYTLAATAQRHRAVFNSIWQMKYGLQLSGLYFFGSGQRYSTSYGGDLRNASISAARLRPDGTIAPRNNLVGDPIHRVDLRFQKRIRLGGSRNLDGIFEVFNLFNHENYGAYTTQESNSQYGKPSQNTNVAYQPRALQLGFRLAF
jgi:hypothetical protein